MAVIFLNRREDYHSFFLPLEKRSRVRDLVKHKDMGVFENRYNFLLVPPHGVHVIKITLVWEKLWIIIVWKVYNYFLK